MYIPVLNSYFYSSIIRRI